MGGVNHCHHAKFRDLMIEGKYGAVIGWKTHVYESAQSEFPGYRFFKPLTAPYSLLYMKSHNFAKSQCGLAWQWLTPPTKRRTLM
jgi:hypothetical protein